MKLNEEEYLQSRVDDQILWYDQKSLSSQRKYKTLKSFEILAASFIPVIAGFGKGYMPVEMVIAILGALVAIAAAMISSNQYNENWIKYRTTCESLKHEKFLFLTQTHPYNIENTFCLFVSRVEDLISRENTIWLQSNQLQRNAEKVNKIRV